MHDNVPDYVAFGPRGKSRSQHFVDIWLDLRDNGPSTYKEVTERTGIRGPITSTHMSAMIKAGILRDRLQKDGEPVRRNHCAVRELVDPVAGDALGASEPESANVDAEKDAEIIELRGQVVRLTALLKQRNDDIAAVIEMLSTIKSAQKPFVR